jgi:glycosyltransferase involved in cell wall biosynthesis
LRSPLSLDTAGCLPEGIPARPPLHVLTLTPFYPALGDETRGCFVAEPLPRLEALGVSHTVFAVQPFYHGRAHPSRTAVPACWSSFFSLPGGVGLASSGAFLSASILPKVRRLHRIRPVHVIHAHSALPCGHAASLLARKLNIPFVVTVHGLDVFSTRQVGGALGAWCKRNAQRVYRSARQVICISDKVRENVVLGASLSVNTAVVYNGVDEQLFAPSQEGSASYTILSVGNLIPVKGHELLLRAFAAIHRRFPDFRCDLIGEGPELSRLRSLARELALADKVRFLGSKTRSQVAEAMRSSTLFVLPSTYEGLGCVYLEAMSCQRVAIACQGQGIGEIIRHGENGWLVQPNDAASLSAALSTLLENRALRTQIGERARQTILQGYTLAQQAARLQQIYRESRI